VQAVSSALWRREHEGFTILDMRGIRYVTDDNGKRVAVMLDLAEWGEVWEDFYDVMLAEERRDEPAMALDDLSVS
jgi:hypothetical protein